MSRTTVNVCGDLTAAAFVARSEGVWNASMVPAVEGEVGGPKQPLDDSPGWPPGPTPASDAQAREGAGAGRV
jgi:hypothetical protein